MRKLQSLILLLMVCLLAGCGGGGGAAQAEAPPSGANQSLQLGGTNLSVGQVAVSTSPTWLFTFDVLVDPAEVATYVQLTDGAGVIPVTVDVDHLGRLRVQPVQPLRKRTDYSLTVKSGLKGVNGARLQSDITRHFRTVLFDGVSRVVAPPVPGLTNYSGQHTIRIGDLNGDRLTDIVQIGGDASLTGFGDHNSFGVKIYLQNPDHSFRLAQNLIVRESPNGGGANEMGDIAIVDLDHDGVPEIVIAVLRHDPLSNGLIVLKQDAQGSYAVGEFLATNVAFHLHLVDIDGDGNADLLGIGSGHAMTVGPDRCGMVAILSSPGGARLQDPSLWPCGGFETLVGAMRPGQVQVLRLGPRGNSFFPIAFADRFSIDTLDAQGRPTPDADLMAAAEPVCATMIDCSGLMLLDVNGDGVQDLLFRLAVVGEQSWTTVIYARAGQGAYAELLRQDFGAAYAYMVTDMDRDGLDDVVVVVQSLGGSFIGGGFGTRGSALELSHLVPADAFDTMNQSTVAIGDVDGDGWPDVVLSSYNVGLTVVFQRPN